MGGGAAQAWFAAGTVPFIAAGGLHALGALVDTVRPTYFAPADPAARPAMEASGLRFRGTARRPSVWRAWLGFNLSHGLGVSAFGLVLLLVALHDFALVEGIAALQPLSIAFSATYLVIALRFWFWGPVLITGSATACFTISALMSA